MSYLLRGHKLFQSLITVSRKQPGLSYRLPTPINQRNYHRCTPLLFSKKPQLPPSTDESDWVTIQLGDDEAIGEDEMDRRIREAKSGILHNIDDDDDDDMSELKDIFGVKKSTKKSTTSSSSSSSSSGSSKSRGKKPSEQSPMFHSLKAPGADRYAHLRANKLMVTEEDDINKQIRTFLQMNPHVCCGCGTAFQTRTEDAPGYLPPDKFSQHRQQAEFIRKKQQAIDILDTAELNIRSKQAMKLLRDAGVEDEVVASVERFARQHTHDMKDDVHRHEVSSSMQSEKSDQSEDPVSTTPTTTTSTPLPVTNSTTTLRDVKSNLTAENADHHATICQRCFRLQQYGQIENSLRPGWSQHELLTPQYFEQLLTSIKTTPAVVLCLIDIFDLQGSILKNLKQIIGNNPLVLAVNKIDLLPKDISQIRIKNWIFQEMKRICDFQSPRDVKQLAYHDKQYFQEHCTDGTGRYSDDARVKRPDWKKLKDKDYERNKQMNLEAGTLAMANIHLVSCQNGYNVPELMDHLFTLAKQYDRKIYVMGAANVGKSSLINRFTNPETYTAVLAKKKPQLFRKSPIPLVTVSNLPGTTLDFVKIKLPNEMTLIDTPGLINPGHLTSKLTFDELKQIIPMKPINAITLRVEEGKCVLIGGMVSVEFTQGKPYFFTFFISNEVKLHPTDINKRESFIESHIGKLIFPPANLERVEALGPFKYHVLDLEGKGWEEAAYDIVLPGLGWVAITGCGPIQVSIRAPSDMEITVRESLLPFETKTSTAKFTGSKINKRSSKFSEKAGKAYGWRA